MKQEKSQWMKTEPEMKQMIEYMKTKKVGGVKRVIITTFFIGKELE